MQNKHRPDWARSIHRSPRWVCPLRHDNIGAFDTREQLLEHIRTAHSGEVDETELTFVVSSSQTSQSLENGVCPLCGEIPSELERNTGEAFDGTDPKVSGGKTLLRQNATEIQKGSSFSTMLPSPSSPFRTSYDPKAHLSSSRTNVSISDHIAKHLISISLWSIRWWEDDSGTPDDDSHGVSAHTRRPSQLSSGSLTSGIDVPIDDQVQVPDCLTSDAFDWGHVKPYLVSTQGTLTSQPTQATVDPVAIHRMCIEEFHIDTLHNPRYLPLNAFRDFLNRDRVTITLRSERYLGSHSSQDMQKLVEYSTRNPLVFMTLAMTKLIRKMPLLCAGNFTDKALPVRREYSKETGLKVFSLEDHQNRPWPCFLEGDHDTNSWDWADVDQFVSTQWTFYAVIFENDCFEYEIHRTRPLPYVNLPDTTSAGGHFGKVFKLGLRAEHVRSNFGRYFPRVRQIDIPSHNVLR